MKIDVDQAFVNAAPGSVEVVTAWSTATCGYKFETGRRYLVYASKTFSSHLSTSRCSRTRPIEQAEEDLGYLTSIPSTSFGGRVYGRITHWHREPFEDRAIDYGPMKDIVVNARTPVFSRDAVTDENGRYEIAGVPPGDVTLTVLVPPTFDLRYTEREFALNDPRACSQHDFQIRYIAGASGTVVDSAGRPIAGVSVDAVAAELAGHQPAPFQQPVKTDERGAFRFDDLPPGTYVFGINLTKDRLSGASGVPTFLPGTANAKEASVIELQPGERKEIGVLRLLDGTR